MFFAELQPRLQGGGSRADAGRARGDHHGMLLLLFFFVLPIVILDLIAFFPLPESTFLVGCSLRRWFAHVHVHGSARTLANRTQARATPGPYWPH